MMTPGEAFAEICGAAESLALRVSGISNAVLLCSYELAKGFTANQQWAAPRQQDRPYLVCSSMLGTSNRCYLHCSTAITGVFGWVGTMPTDESWMELLSEAWKLTPDAAVATKSGASDDGTYVVRWCEQPPAGARWIDSRHAVEEREDRRTGEMVIDRVYVLVREGVWAVCDEEQAAVVLDVIATAGEVMGAGKRKPGVVRKRLRWIHV